MLQEDPFFSRPLIYFGSHQNLEEEQEEEEWTFSDPWQIFFDENFAVLQQMRIGLFFHWPDVNE